jgi:hypothetical protein
VPERRALEVEGVEPEKGHVHVDRLPIGHRRLGRVAVLPVAAHGRGPVVEGPRPGDPARLEVEAEQVVLQPHLGRQLAVAGLDERHHLLVRLPLLLQLRDVVVGEIDPQRRGLERALRRGGGQEDFPAPHDGRGPPQARDRGDPFHVLGLRPRRGQTQLVRHRPGAGAAELRPGAVSSRGGDRKAHQEPRESRDPRREDGDGRRKGVAHGVLRDRTIARPSTRGSRRRRSEPGPSIQSLSVLMRGW